MDNEIAQHGEPTQSDEIGTEVSESPCFADPQDQFDYWLDAFDDLAKKAGQDGIQVVCCLGMVNPIDRTSQYSYCSNGDVLAARGLLEFVREDFLGR